MKVQNNYNLKHFNTFGLDAQAKRFVAIHTESDLLQALSQKKADEKLMILGGGSNILLTKDFDGLVIKMDIKGIEIIEETSDFVIIEAGAGESWHDLVQFTVQKNYGGIENLSLIPGTVGAAPMQNIGAYGVELNSVFERLDAYLLIEGEFKMFDKQACQFAYRSSVFKTDLKHKAVITRVRLRLSKHPKVNISYGAIKDTLWEMGVSNPDIADVSKAVISIRQSKLPDPAELGNSGSFFKNPEIPIAQFAALKAKHDNIPGYPTTHDLVKVPAGWLIEHAGWKGKRVGNTGSHKSQALVLVNYGGAKGDEILKLSLAIKSDIREKFGIQLETEVNVI